jgi:prephenate dehydrogenase
MDMVEVTVEIPDEPRALGRLFTDIGDAGLNVEDFELTHDPVRQVGYLSISVESDVGELLRVRLTDAGWHAWSDTRGGRR